jgi:hypothetical protein
MNMGLRPRRIRPFGQISPDLRAKSRKCTLACKGVLNIQLQAVSAVHLRQTV